MNTQFDEKMEAFFNARQYQNKIYIREDWLVSTSSAEEAKGKCGELVRKQSNWIIENKWTTANIEYGGCRFEDRHYGSVILHRGCATAILYNKNVAKSLENNKNVATSDLKHSL
jgi:hypothetical protein